MLPSPFRCFYSNSIYSRKRSNVHVDETLWCVMGVKEWLWTATGKIFCLFDAADTRSRAELETMLGNEFAGVLSFDDFSAGRVTRHAVYNGCQVGAQQKCLAHLRRHFKRVLKITHGNNTIVATAFLALMASPCQNGKYVR